MRVQIEVDTDLMQRDIRMLEAKRDSLRKSFSIMTNELLDLSSKWEGPAKEAFMAQLSIDMQFIDEVMQCLTDTIDDLTYAKDEYDRCDREVATIVASL